MEHPITHTCLRCRHYLPYEKRHEETFTMEDGKEVPFYKEVPPRCERNPSGFKHWKDENWCRTIDDMTPSPSGCFEQYNLDEKEEKEGKGILNSILETFGATTKKEKTW